MKRTIWTNNYDWITEEQLKESLQENNELNDILNDDVTEEDLYNWKYELEEMYFNDECENLNKELDGRVIAIANLGLWNGRVSGYKICEYNLNEILKVGNEDITELYQDSYDIYKTSIHHDGRNSIMFREVREDRNIEILLEDIYNGKEITRRRLNYYTKSLNKHVNEIYG